MSAARPLALYELFLELRALARDERGARLEAVRAREPALADELGELLRMDETAGGFLETPALGAEIALGEIELLDEPSGERAAHALPQRIGRYRIEALLGRGGMGVVYRATQEGPQRAVALKVLRRAQATPRRIKRFEHEAELLARLSHPGIAQVFEAGVTEDGRAFFALELVEGADLRAHARAAPLELEARLALLIQIAEAVAHAHQKGVVHRDLKPENILVDAAGRAKIVDFGVARWVGPDSGLATLHTEEGRLVGTPWYMSPEQLSGEPDAADTRSDVHALGVIGYELVSGSLPYRLAGKPLAEVARVIRDEPPAPLPASARVPPDLAVVLEKCLAKDPARRYGGAAELAADLRRVRAHEPISARPPSGVYLLRKFVRRNRALALSLAGLLVALVLGVAGFATQAARATRERDLAREAESKASEALRFLQSMLLSVEAAESGRELRVADELARWSASLAGTFTHAPEIEADLRRAIGASFRALGLLEESLRELRRSVALYEAHAPDDPELGVARSDAALLLTELGRFDEAEPIYRRALADQEARLGPDDPAAHVTRNNLAALLARLGKDDEAERGFRAVLAAEAALATDDVGRRLLGSARRGLAGLVQEHGELVEARALLERAVLDLGAAFGESDADLLATLNNLGALEASAGNPARAIELLERSRAGYAALLPPEHPSLLTLDNNLGTLLARAGRQAEGEPRLRAALEGRRALLGPEHQSTLTTASNLGGVWLELGRVEEAEALLRETKAALERTLPAGHWMPLATGVRLAECCMQQGRTLEARALLEASLNGLAASLGREAEKTRSAARLLARLSEELGEEPRALAIRAEFGLPEE